MTDSGPKDLGMLSSKSTSLTLTINKDTEYTFEQSISNLNNTASSTGFVLWKISILFLDWILNNCTPYYDFTGKYVVELGAGVSGIFTSFIGRRSARYIATDQYHLLKLLKKNISESGMEFKSSTIDVKGSKGSSTSLGKGTKKSKRSTHSAHIRTSLPTIEACCYDWENIEQGQFELKEINPDGTGKPDFIIGCDIVYNDYLVPHLINAIDSLSGPDTVCLIGLQLRLLENVELFVQTLLERGFEVYSHMESILTDELKDGFVIYHIKRSTNVSEE